MTTHTSSICIIIITAYVIKKKYVEKKNSKKAEGCSLRSCRPAALLLLCNLLAQNAQLSFQLC